MFKSVVITVLFFTLQTVSYSQEIALFQQFNGKYDFTMIGNTLNPDENSFMASAVINTSSSASLNMNQDDIIEKAFLYWAGCGPGDFEIQLNNTVIVPQRFFQYNRISNGSLYDYFSAFADITDLVQATGNGLYSVSEFDLNPWISYFFQNRTNFGGWAIVVVYKNENSTFNQLNIYDGLQAVPNAISITLDNLAVENNENATIGFLAWEGDEDIAVNENLTINGDPLGNPPLNPFSNAFNGTSSITNNESLHNMDLDIYNIQDNVQVGDTSALIQLSSGRDFVMVNTIVTKFNILVPDAQINIDKVDVACNTNDIIIHYTVSNIGTTEQLPSNVPIAIYVNDVFYSSTATIDEIAGGSTENNFITLQIPSGTESPFEIRFVIDDVGTGEGIVVELDENNNISTEFVSFVTSQEISPLPDLSACNEGFGSGTFDFSAYEGRLKQNPDDQVAFFSSLEDLQNNANAISNLTNFSASSTPMRIFAKLDNGSCFQFTSFLLKTIKCKPIVYNYVSANDDGTNDTFNIKNLRNVFLNFKLEVYNRWGKLIWTGYNNTENWDGKATNGIVVNKDEITDGTYFYKLELNDPDYPEPLVGYLFLKQ